MSRVDRVRRVHRRHREADVQQRLLYESNKAIRGRTTQSPMPAPETSAKIRSSRIRAITRSASAGSCPAVPARSCAALRARSRRSVATGRRLLLVAWLSAHLGVRLFRSGLRQQNRQRPPPSARVFPGYSSPPRSQPPLSALSKVASSSARLKSQSAPAIHPMRRSYPAAGFSSEAALGVSRAGLSELSLRQVRVSPGGSSPPAELQSPAPRNRRLHRGNLLLALFLFEQAGVPLPSAS